MRWVAIFTAVLLLSALSCKDESNSSKPAPEAEQRVVEKGGIASGQQAKEQLASKGTVGSQKSETVRTDPDEGASVATEKALSSQKKTAVDSARVDLKDDEIAKLLDSVVDRKSCNEVMGCKAGELLKSGGGQVAALAMERYDRIERPSYQKYHLIDIVAATGGEEVVGWLEARLDEPHWGARSRAAVGLGTVGARRSLPKLQSLVEKEMAGADKGVLYAAAHAIAKLAGDAPGAGDTEGERAHSMRILLDAVQPDSIGRINWGYTRIAVAALGDLKYVEACPFLPSAVRHSDLFLKKEALTAIRMIGCRQESVLSAVSEQLDSKIPSVRKGASDTLESLTGLRIETLSQWEAYQRTMTGREGAVPAGTKEGDR